MLQIELQIKSNDFKKLPKLHKEVSKYEKESQTHGFKSKATPWIKVFGISDIDEEDKSDINILGNDASLCYKLEEEAQSFLKKNDIKLN